MLHALAQVNEHLVLPSSSPPALPATAISQQTRDIHPMLFQCWPSVEDDGPTLKQHWVNAPCLLGLLSYVFISSCWKQRVVSDTC